jgi:primosomal replication protein N
MYTEDIINELTISGHINHPPRLHGAPDDLPHCEFVLTHTTHVYDRHGWEQQHYNVIAHGRVGVAFAERHQPGQVLVITGELDPHLRDTLTGPLPAITMIQHRIITIDGPLTQPPAGRDRPQ